MNRIAERFGSCGVVEYRGLPWLPLSIMDGFETQCDSCMDKSGENVLCWLTFIAEVAAQV
ncbi:hypothetical protein FTO74_06120 [Granulicella sp. WH15]|uniref:hypothetical protein n=1 Tax=Granulicella sp. WH15 TaxID=2602070 RepID=UPI001366FE7B|nr:hypothetical protein [Granulicella sp. WH15]QHN02992.1 hypothetical protein FTO74_06120 [Granulicella sp. WH15]